MIELFDDNDHDFYPKGLGFVDRVSSPSSGLSVKKS